MSGNSDGFVLLNELPMRWQNPKGWSRIVRGAEMKYGKSRGPAEARNYFDN